MPLNTHSLKATRPVVGLVDHLGMASTIQKGERHVLDIHVDCGCGCNVHDPWNVFRVVQGIKHCLDGCSNDGTGIGGKFGDEKVGPKVTTQGFCCFKKESVSWQ